MFQTSLYHKDNFSLPQMRALDTVQSALERDAQSQTAKYVAGMSQVSGARFNVDLPQSPQHLKYSNTSSPKSAPGANGAVAWNSENSKGASPSSRPTCLDSLTDCKSKLRVLFGEIDNKNTGYVTLRSVIMTLHQRLYEEFGESDEVREATCWLREAAKEVDVEGKGIMDWKAFLDFCKRAGIFIEYQLHKDTTHTEVDAVRTPLSLNGQQEEELKSSNTADVQETEVEVRSESQSSPDRDNVAGFNSNRRAGSPNDEKKKDDE